MSKSKSNLPVVEIYTDGACLGNPGPGGYAVILKQGDKEKELSGGEVHTTNNRMELLAVITGLSALKKRCKVILYTDSKYIVNAIQQHWLQNWIRNGWHTKNKGGKVKNQDLWEQIIELNIKHKVCYTWVKGHAGNEYNERCDHLARDEAFKMYKANKEN